MKIVEKVFMLIAFLSAVVSMMLSIKSGEAFGWQAITLMWILIAYFKTKLLDRYENLIEKMSK